MEQEEGWLRYIKLLNVLPNIVTLQILAILLFGNGFWWTYNEHLYGLLSLISTIGYLFSYFIKPSEFRRCLKIYIWGFGIITTTIWLILFSFLAIMFLDRIAFFSISLSLFLVSYPSYLLYLYFRLFMNELSKPNSEE